MKDKTGKVLTYQEVVFKAKNRFISYLLDFQLMLLNIISATVPSHSLRKLFFQTAGVKIGKKSFVHMGVRFYYPLGITIGEGTIIGDGTFLDGRAPLKIGNHTSIASQVLIYNSEHDIHDENFKPTEEAVEIGDYVFVGPRAIILPGVKIRKGAIVAAGAVVTKDVAENAIVGGVPAHVIGQRRARDFNYRLGRPKLFQ